MKISEIYLEGNAYGHSTNANTGNSEGELERILV